MKIFKFGLRLWITITSILTFLIGWIMLAHAPKPVQASPANAGVADTLPTLEPLPPLDASTGSAFQSQSQPFFSNQQPQMFRSRPFFSTGGS